jgi:hypothetical protein
MRDIQRFRNIAYCDSRVPSQGQPRVLRVVGTHNFDLSARGALNSAHFLTRDRTGHGLGFTIHSHINAAFYTAQFRHHQVLETRISHMPSQSIKLPQLTSVARQ